ncbi:Peptidase family M50 [Anatilimnocola aggregata]|uniref:Peptidase family M50 n=1 Tax=Anatilimnocola aggregata TaxID=2528021 RepID=A0A517YLS3_9BACT|nr:HlyD family efflux transporter periplasmic adaptor subunit [Anatilimnocola aggregata]QDU31166.1 Peptidase family M50 [Anatilimnocola aggregata]
MQTNLQELYASSTSRALGLRMRADLEVVQQAWQGRSCWVIKDPLALKYFRFEEEEYSLLTWLDGKTSLDELRERFQAQFSPQKLAVAQLQHLLTMLHRSNLIVSLAAGQGESLRERHETRERKKFWATLSNPLAMRFRGIDPDRLLTFLNATFGWLFSPLALVLGVCFAMSAGLLLAAQWQEFSGRLPQFREFFAVSNWLLLAVVMSLVKVLHEFGHGVACRRYGGHSHELGLMLLVFTPCLYCNVTDSWVIRSKWRRAMIGAAGMYIELLLAAACTWIWWFTQPGLLHHLCLNTMFVCSVSTLMFNANPLMRYDGYYILCDLLEIPNLRPKASALVKNKASAWFLGMKETVDPFLPVRGQIWFVLFAVASTCYGWFVTFSVLWFLTQVFKPYGLAVLGQGLVLISLATMILLPLWRVIQLFRIPGRRQQMKTSRVLLSGIALAGLAAAIFCIPLPHNITCAVLLQPKGAEAIYVEVPGEVVHVWVTQGHVEKDQPLMQLRNLDAEIAAQKLRAQRDGLIAKIDGLRTRAHVDPNALLDIAQTEEALSTLQKQLQQRETELRKMIVVAPFTGQLLPPPEKQPSTDKVTLASWAGRPLTERNRGAFLDKGTVLGKLAPSGEFEAVLAIDQNAMEFVRPGQAVDLILDQWPGRKLAGRIEHLSEQPWNALPPSLSAKSGGRIVTRTGPNGAEHPVSETFQASVPLSDTDDRWIAEGTGQARIHAGTLTLAQHAWRMICRTFRFQL